MSQHQGYGKQLTLYDGTRIRVAAMPLFAADEFTRDVSQYFGNLAAQLEGKSGAGPTPAAPRVTWVSTLVFILATSNPGLGVDVEWCREHVYLPDIAAIAKAWIAENRLEPLLATLKDGVASAILDVLRAATSAVAAPAAGKVQ